MVIIETIHKFTTDKHLDADDTNHRSNQPMRVRCYTFIGLFMIGSIVQLATVFIVKYLVGKFDIARCRWVRDTDTFDSPHMLCSHRTVATKFSRYL